jgi:hypothetical protein
MTTQFRVSYKKWALKIKKFPIPIFLIPNIMYSNLVLYFYPP